MAPAGPSSTARFLGGLPTADLAEFNRWLCVTRLRAAGALVLFSTAIAWFGVGSIDPAAVLLVCSALGLVSVLGLTSALPHRQPQVFFYGQSLADLLAVTFGVILAADGTEALFFCLLFVIVVVPMSLVSVTSGIVAALAGTVGHFVVVGVELGYDPDTFRFLETAGVPVLLLLVAQQCRFYAEHLGNKNRALASFAIRLEENQHALAAQARTSHALFDVAGTLASTTDGAELLRRLNETVATHLDAAWAATFLVDDARQTFRLAATTDSDAPVDDLARLELPISAWPAIERLRSLDVVTLTGPVAQRIPSLLTSTGGHDTVLLAGLQGHGSLAGFLAVGFDALDVAASERGGAFLHGMARHASLVLRNARLFEEVRLASAMKSEFVGAISHELRSPLNVTLGYLEMLDDEALGPLAASQRAAVAAIRQESLSLLEMITALLDLNRLEAGRLPVTRRPVDLAGLFTEICEGLPPGWRRPDVAVTIDVAPNVPVLSTDAGKLKTVVRNLLHNALKFTERGWVSLSASVTPAGDVTIAVRDTGCGIPAEALDYIFEMFRQVPGSGGGGVGLGLHLVWRLVTVLGGSVEVASEERRGSLFTVTLPRTEVLPADELPGQAA